jgi:hypothetical protein
LSQRKKASAGRQQGPSCVHEYAYAWIWDYVDTINKCAHNFSYVCTVNLCFHSRGQEAERTPPVPHKFKAQSSNLPGHPDASGIPSPVHPAPLHPSQALRMLVKIMHVHSAVVTKAILEQLCSSGVLEVSSGLPSSAPGQGW